MLAEWDYFRTLVRNLYDYHRSELLAAVTNEYTDWENPKVFLVFQYF